MTRVEIQTAVTAAVALLGLAAGACDPARRSETVTGMRVLAVRAEPPTARPGDAVRLEALVATRVEDDPDVSLTWFLCAGDFDACASADVPGGEGVTVIGQGRAVETTIPAGLLPGETMVFWMDARRGGAHERSIKGVYVRPESEPPNHNPRLDRVRWGAGPTPIEETPVGSRVTIRVGSSEMMNEIRLEAGEPASEDVQILAYTTAGALVDPSGSGASGALYFEAPSRKERVGTWIVVNDGRGGVDWYEHWIRVTGKAEEE